MRHMSLFPSARVILSLSAMINSWDLNRTDALRERREATIRAKKEELIKTAVQREEAAKLVLRYVPVRGVSKAPVIHILYHAATGKWMALEDRVELNTVQFKKVVCCLKLSPF